MDYLFFSFPFYKQKVYYNKRNSEVADRKETIGRKFIMRNWKIFLAVFGGIFILVICYIWNQRTSPPVTKERLDELLLPDVKRLMIVAHPDDETLWGGAHLAEESYLVVCLTNGTSDIRKAEFLKAVTAAGSVPLILEYPDKIFGIRSRWVGLEHRISDDLKVLLSYKNWELVVTHNPEGEYGHIHHKKTSRLVTKAAKEQNTTLYYFGIYETKEQMESKSAKTKGQPLTESEYEQKLQRLEFYQSQKKTIELFSHMLPYEIWIPENSWNKTDI